MSQIVLDAEAFRALSSDTRLQILKALDVRRLTVSELGRLLDLNKATVFEHLKQLSTAGLVKKEDEGRKWVYYKLTWKGRNVLHPENVQFMLLLGTATLSVGGLVAQLGRFLDWWGGAATSRGELDPLDSAPTPTTDALREDADTADAPAMRAGGTAGDHEAATTAPTATGSLEGAPPNFIGDPEAAGDDALWTDPGVWLMALLALLLVATLAFTYQYLRQRRREQDALRLAVARLPPPEPDNA